MAGDVLAQIVAAFGGAPRPPDGALLHERCLDDNDTRLHGLHAAPSGSGAAAVHATIWALSPEIYTDEALREFARSKLVPLDRAQRAAAVAFREAAEERGDGHVAGECARALAWWRRP